MHATTTFLRAELIHGAATIVGHTTVVTPQSVFVRIDELIDLGASVELALSFRGALPPLRFRGVVTEHRRPAGPGELAGLWLALHACTEQDSEGLRSVLEITQLGPASREVRVLLVDDSSLTRDVFAHVVSLDPTRVRLDSVADPEVAWARLQAGDYHLLLVDHFLPSSSGAQLVARVRADARLSTLPTVGISIGGKVARDAMLSAGVDLFLDKPVRVRDVLATLDRLAGIGEEHPA